MMDYIRALLDFFKNIKSQHKKILELENLIHEKDSKILELEKRNSQLNESLTIRSQVIYDDNSYWLPEGSKRTGPFCTLCYDDSQKLVRKLRDQTERFYCPKCEKPIIPVRIY